MNWSDFNWFDKKKSEAVICCCISDLGIYVVTKPKQMGQQVTTDGCTCVGIPVDQQFSGRPATNVTFKDI